MKKIEIPENIILASVWVVWAFLAVGALGWALFVVLKAFDATKDAAAWVQAVGSIAAIIAAIIISSADRSFTRDQIRSRNIVVIRAAEELCFEAYCAILHLNRYMVTHYQPVTSDSPPGIRQSLQKVEAVLRDLSAIDLMSMPTPAVVDCILEAKGIAQYCRTMALEGWDPALAIDVPEFDPLGLMLIQVEKQIKLLRSYSSLV
ncbi:MULTISPECIES: hypothetical protein [unclassified Pseudomonas]|uniref:hypothetical protein n=1 Tax=unclassified Pseudomonas TaxID=196821 RepID=UPI0011B52068|nr:MULTISPECIES: hypothetical protein [unclassified Pseudomonas]